MSLRNEVDNALLTALANVARSAAEAGDREIAALKAELEKQKAELAKHQKDGK